MAVSIVMKRPTTILYVLWGIWQFFFTESHAFLPPPTTTTTTTTHPSRRRGAFFHYYGSSERRPLFSSSSRSNSDNLSASARERHEEEKRRQARKEDVVIGKTSAMPDAKDYAFDPSVTEQEYLRQASNVQQEIFLKTDQGMRLLKLFQLEDACRAFDRVFELRPNAYVWQAGVAKFYLNELHQAADIFARNAFTYEGKFGTPASEERIWRDACELKLRSTMTKQERKEQQQQDDKNAEPLMVQVRKRETGELNVRENRKVLRIARDLFSAALANDYSTVVLSQAKLRSICGSYEETPRPDQKMWKLSSWYYLGLYYDAVGDVEESKNCMKMALRLCPSVGNGNDIIHTLPALHMAMRDWYDDDDFEPSSHAGIATKSAAPTTTTTTPSDTERRTSPVVLDSIRSSIAKLKYLETQDALKARGLKCYGSKEELQKKLFNSLLEDAGLET